MKESVHEYFQAGTIQWMSYPQRGPMESLKAIRKDDFFDAVGLKGYDGENEEAEELLEQSHLKVYYGAQPRPLGGKLNPNDLDEEGRRKVETTLIEAVDEAEYLGAKRIAFLAGRWQPETRDQAYAQLLKTTRAARDHVTAKGMTVELEVSDYDMDEAVFIGLALYTAEPVADMRTIHNNLGLLVDLSRSPTTYEISRFVIHTLRLYITHFHFGNAVVVKGCDGYDGLCPRFGYPNSANDVPQPLDHLKVTKEKGFSDAENPHVLSMEVILRPDEDEGVALANTKRVLNRVWALLEDNV